MTSSKKSFKNFRAFPGSVNGSGVYEFPTLTKKDKSGNSRFWTIFVRLIVHEGPDGPARRKQNWLLSEDKSVEIKDEYFEGKSDYVGPYALPDNVIAQYWTEHGIIADAKSDKKYAVSRTAPTFVRKGKNIGKINATTVFTQALIGARSKYDKVNNEHVANRYYPMALHKYSLTPRDESKQIKYPVAVQPKLDGVRIVAYWDIKKRKTVMYSRKLKDIASNDHIIRALNALFRLINCPGIYLDGELYKHGMHVQEISGLARGDSKSTEAELHIFDCFFPYVKLEKMKKYRNMGFHKRNVLLREIFGKVDDADTKTSALIKKCIKKVDTYTATSKEHEDMLYEQSLKKGYEGTVVKNMDGEYKYSSEREYRTYQARKRKPRETAEFEIVGFTQGRSGRAIGALIWKLKTPGCLCEEKKCKCPYPKKIMFPAIPKGPWGTDEKRYEMFESFNTTDAFEQFKGKKMTVEFDTYSKDGVPLYAWAIAVRDID